MSKISFDSSNNRSLLPSEKISRMHYGTIIQGDITGSDILFFNGTLVGNIKLTNKLVLGEKANVKGNIDAMHIIVKGRVEGQLRIQGKAAFGKNSSFKGEITANTLEVEAGAVFNAACLAGTGDGKDSFGQPFADEPLLSEEDLVMDDSSGDLGKLFMGHFSKSVIQKTYSIFIL